VAAPPFFFSLRRVLFLLILYSRKRI
jgi:hypothetical protein